MTRPGSRAVLDWGVDSYERTARLLLPAAQVLVDAAGLRAGERVLDLGSGTGFRLLQQLGHGERGREHLLQVLTEHNEDPGAFRRTSRHLVFVARAS